eukprot:1141441-Pelagomonas_calceolata.AAC.3
MLDPEGGLYAQSACVHAHTRTRAHTRTLTRAHTHTHTHTHTQSHTGTRAHSHANPCPQAGEKEAIASKVTGDVVAELLPLVDNFELARTQVKVESEGENKINSSGSSGNQNVEINPFQRHSSGWVALHVNCAMLLQEALNCVLLVFPSSSRGCVPGSWTMVARGALYKQLVDVMRGFGIEAVPTVGAAFDPEIHDAMMREHSEEVRNLGVRFSVRAEGWGGIVLRRAASFEHYALYALLSVAVFFCFYPLLQTSQSAMCMQIPEGHISQEFRKGFRMGEKLVRPAMVMVSMKWKRKEMGDKD